MADTVNYPKQRGLPSLWRQQRWQLAAAGFGIGVLYTLGAWLSGLEISWGGRDVTVWVGGLIEISFAIWGYLLGANLELREREQETSARLRLQTDNISRIRARLAETEKLAALGQVAGTIAHEVRNPLAILRTMTQNLTEAADKDEINATCEMLIDEIDRLSRVTSSLLDLAQPLTLVKSTLGIDEILDRTELLAGQMLANRSITLQRGAASSPEQGLEADPDLICQVLLELLANAADASGEGGVVQLAAETHTDREPPRVELAVTDQGPGIPGSLREKIFEPFYTTRQGGHGLGLAVARQIVEAHGGKLAVTDGPSGGARFQLHLPITPTLPVEVA
ncbi:MAG: ATP-binding protein [Acidobacteriota bacterium]